MPTIRYAARTTMKMSALTQAHQMIWRCTLRGTIPLFLHAQNRFPTALVLVIAENRLLALRWHMEMFPILPRNPQLETQLIIFAQSRLLTKYVYSLTLEDPCDFSDCISKFFEIVQARHNDFQFYNRNARRRNNAIES